MAFYLVCVRTRKKVEKYFKVNKIRNKYVIDIKKILDEEKIDIEDSDALAFFKVLIWKRIQLAKEKKKDVYYIPNFYNQNLDIIKLLDLKNLVDDGDFNLLLFFQEFVSTIWLNDIMDNIHVFNVAQVIKDY